MILVSAIDHVLLIFQTCDVIELLKNLFVRFSSALPRSRRETVTKQNLKATKPFWRFDAKLPKLLFP